MGPEGIPCTLSASSRTFFASSMACSEAAFGNIFLRRGIGKIPFKKSKVAFVAIEAAEHQDTRQLGILDKYFGYQLVGIEDS